MLKKIKYFLNKDNFTAKNEGPSDVSRPSIKALLVWGLGAVPLTMLIFYNYPLLWMIFTPILYVICALTFKTKAQTIEDLQKELDKNSPEIFRTKKNETKPSAVDQAIKKWEKEDKESKERISKILKETMNKRKDK